MAYCTITHYNSSTTLLFLSAENVAPNITGSVTFRVNLQTESLFTFSVADPGDNFTVSIQGELPPEFFLEYAGSGEYTFRWNLQQVTNVPLVFVATDTQNVSSTFIPTVEVCACANDGICTVEGIITTNSTITMTCRCSEGKLITINSIHYYRSLAKLCPPSMF